MKTLGIPFFAALGIATFVSLSVGAAKPAEATVAQGTSRVGYWYDTGVLEGATGFSNLSYTPGCQGGPYSTTITAQTFEYGVTESYAGDTWASLTNNTTDYVTTSTPNLTVYAYGGIEGRGSAESETSIGIARAQGAIIVEGDDGEYLDDDHSIISVDNMPPGTTVTYTGKCKGSALLY